MAKGDRPLSVDPKEDINAYSAEGRDIFQRVIAISEKIADNAKNLRNETDASATQCDLARELAREAGEKVESLINQMQRVNEAIKPIHEVTSLVNLLALNATIEAARAGDSGKGFAVIASEAKKIANVGGTISSDVDMEINITRQQTQSVSTTIQKTAALIKSVSENSAETNRASEIIYESAGNLIYLVKNVKEPIITNQKKYAFISLMALVAAFTLLIGGIWGLVHPNPINGAMTIIGIWSLVLVGKISKVSNETW